MEARAVVLEEEEGVLGAAEVPVEVEAEEVASFPSSTSDTPGTPLYVHEHPPSSMPH